MPTPNAKMKIKKEGITFESNVDAVKYSIAELTCSALKDIARLIKYETVKKIRTLPGMRKSKRANKAIGTWVRKKECDLQIGYGHNKKDLDGTTWYGGAAEIGAQTSWGSVDGRRGKTSKAQPQRAFLRNSVKENIDKIELITSQYLKKIDEKKPDIEENEDESEITDE